MGNLKHTLLNPNDEWGNPDGRDLLIARINAAGQDQKQEREAELQKEAAEFAKEKIKHYTKFEDQEITEWGRITAASAGDTSEKRTAKLREELLTDEQKRDKQIAEATARSEKVIRESLAMLGSGALPEETTRQKAAVKQWEANKEQQKSDHAKSESERLRQALGI